MEKPEKSTQKPRKGGFVSFMKRALHEVFIDGLSGMATGLFATLIIGTIIDQIGSFIPGSFGYYVRCVGAFAKVMMGFGIGVGVAYKLKMPPLVALGGGVSGMIGAFASKIIAGTAISAPFTVTTLQSVGEPLGAFVAAYAALKVGALVSGRTKVDIIVTPVCSIAAGAALGLPIGPPISAFMTWIGSVINAAAQQQPIPMGILVAVLMGVALTLPISSAAIGVALGLGGVAAGAAVVGCCCQMVGFAVMSFRENRWGGLAAQGLGTSMLQMPNILLRPVIWLPPIIASAICGPLASAAFGMVSTPVGSGMGTAGLVGPFQTYMAMTAAGTPVVTTLLEIALLQFLLPAVICLLLSELMRKFNLIRENDLKLSL